MDRKRDTEALQAASDSNQPPPPGLVSVVVPAYNVAQYIAQTLDSVFAQTYRNFEVIVVNDGSPDTPLLEAALLPYRNRIVYVVQENRGLSGARNAGIKVARGEFIALLDADDLWFPNYLEVQTAFLIDNPEYDLVYCNAQFFGDPIYAGKLYNQVCPSTGPASDCAIISRRCHVFVSVMARAAVLRAIGFDESLRSCEDFDCWLRLTSQGFKIGYHPQPLVHYRRHDASLSANPLWMAEHNLKVLKKARAYWPAGSEQDRLLLAAAATKSAELEILRGKRALQRGETASAILHLKAGNLFYKSSRITAILLLLQTVPALVRSSYKLRGSLLRKYRDPLASADMRGAT